MVRLRNGLSIRSFFIKLAYLNVLIIIIIIVFTLAEKPLACRDCDKTFYVAVSGDDE